MLEGIISKDDLKVQIDQYDSEIAELTEQITNNGDIDHFHAIQDWLGHSTFNVTTNFYSHLDYKSRISSAEVISNALGDEEDENEGEKKNAGSN